MNKTIANYEVISKIGEGGMGEVYRARDTKLNRDVAIKVLPDGFTEDAERVARFQREAQVLASLNHPNIAAIYGLEESDGIRALVMELVEGPTLADRVAAGPIPVDEALAIARQIAEALEVAHERGIIHRDLKPANVKVTPDDTAKVLDFGLAKVFADETPDADLSHSPTLIKGTQAGMILGTAAYMSPEQAKGKAVDKRSDIWAFGCVLFEMLTGRQAFIGETLTDTLAAVVRAEPEWDTLPASTPEVIQRLLRRCLTKDLKQRLRDIGEARIQIEECLAHPAARSQSKVAPTRPLIKSWPLWTSVGLTIALVASLVLLWRATRPESRSVVRYNVQAPDKTTLGLSRWPVVALSPDGSSLAFIAVSADGIERLYVKKRDDPEVKLLAGTEGAADPAFSPDGKSLAFVADFTLKKLSFDGSVLSLTKVADTRGVTWAGDDTLVYSPEVTGGLFQISANGGAPRAITTVDFKKNERTHRWPQVLPGGKAVLFTVGTINSPDNYDGSNIEAVNLTTGERRVVLQSASMARYVPTRHLIFARGGLLYAIAFDAGSLATHGKPVPVVQGVAGDKTTGAVHFVIANDGTLAYVPGSNTSSLRRPVLVDRSGNVQAVNLPGGQYNDPRFSPDGSRVALLQGSSGGGDVWVYDFGRGTFTRLTFTATNATPIWSPDGKSIYYVSIDQAGNKSTIFRKPADGSREAEAVTTINSDAYLKAIERDGEAALCDAGTFMNRGDIIRVPLKQDAQSTPIINTQFNEFAAALSADGRWLAYQSNESGGPEVYVHDMAGSGGRWQISTAGGEEPRWSPDTRELYYRNNNLFMSVAVDARSAFQNGTPKTLFNGVYDLRSNSGVSYDVDPKGNRFFMIRLAENANSTAQVRIVLNWFDELRRLAPGQ
jgi:serine/threonine-protein kinase